MIKQSAGRCNYHRFEHFIREHWPVSTNKHIVERNHLSNECFNEKFGQMATQKSTDVRTK